MRVLGEKIVAFVILKSGVEEAEELKKEISTHVRKVLGPVASPDKIYSVKDSPLAPGPARSCSASLMALAEGLGD